MRMNEIDLRRTSKGRLAVELAEELNTFGSHDSVAGLSSWVWAVGFLGFS